MAVTAFASGTWTDLKGATVTVTIATPGVFTKTSHGLSLGDAVVFQTTGALPTGITAGTTYYVSNLPNANDFRVSTTRGGSDQATSGTQSGTHSFTSVEHLVGGGVNVAGTFTMHVDGVNLASGDVVEFRCYQMVLTSGTPRVAYFASYTGAQPTDDVIKISVPMSNELTDTYALMFTIKQTVGTARAYPFKVLKYA